MAGKKHVTKKGKRVFLLSKAERERTRAYNREWRRKRREAEAAGTAGLVERAEQVAPVSAATVGLEPTMPAEGPMGIENFPVARILRLAEGQIVLLDGHGAAIVLRLLEGCPGQLAVAPMPESWVRLGTDPKGIDVKDVRGVVTL